MYFFASILMYSVINFCYSIFYPSYICDSTMATRHERVLVSLVYVLALKYILLSFHLVALTTINQSMMIMLFLIVESNARPRFRSLWRYGRVKGFVQRHFISGQTSFFSPQMIKERLRLSSDTFVYLCEVLSPMLQKDKPRMELGIDVETQVAVTLSRLSTGNTLRMCGEMYGLAESTTSIIVRKCCEAIKMSREVTSGAKSRQFRSEWTPLGIYVCLDE